MGNAIAPGKVSAHGRFADYPVAYGVNQFRSAVLLQPVCLRTFNSQIIRYFILKRCLVLFIRKVRNSRRAQRARCIYQRHALAAAQGTCVAERQAIRINRSRRQIVIRPKGTSRAFVRKVHFPKGKGRNRIFALLVNDLSSVTLHTAAGRRAGHGNSIHRSGI